MSRYFLFFSIVCFNSCFSLAQKSTGFFFNEFHLSVNTSTFIPVENSQLGFGVGINRVIEIRDFMALCVGFEFNVTNQRLTDQEVHYKFSSFYSKLEKITIGSLSIPFTARFSLGKQHRFFIEPGIYFNANVLGKVYGASYDYAKPDFSERFKDDANLMIPNGGVSIGLGWKQQFDKVNLIIKPEVKFGFMNVLDGDGPNYNYCSNRYVRLLVGIRF